MICFPNAKINLGLNIVSKRDDGYHNLETIFYPIAIKDALEIIIKENQTSDRFIQEGIKIMGCSDDNLVMKALRLMRQQYEFPILDIHLLKKIPFGAGIGGGSADASFMLRLLNDTFSLGISTAELAAMALKLGADCPFFIYNRPMFASGVGEKFEDIELSLKGYNFVLIKPNIHVTTKDAFALVKPSSPELSLKNIVQQPMGKWKELITNDFEKSIFPQYLAIEAIKNELYEQGAIYASMTGSGSSVFGIFNQEINNLEGYFPTCYTWQGRGL